MKSKQIFFLFVFVAIAQAFVPLKMIYDTEKIQREGRVYKFKTEPIDPNDPFRGKYITLGFDAENQIITDTIWNVKESVYVSIENDGEGFAYIKEVMKQKPENGDYFTAEVSYYNNYDKKLNLNFPFNRYYMEESKAPKAELAYREFSGADNSKPAYALVAIKDGNASLKDVIVDGKPITDYVMENQE